MIVLGIESSCDETGVALVKTAEGSPGPAPTWPVLLAQALHSQIEMHQAYGGVVPELASRDHIRRAGLAAAWHKPLLGVHHLEGHLLSPFLSQDPPTFPFVALLVSGGHTQLMQVNAVGNYALLGETIDDAAGEAFDKSAKLLGLPYPGGPGLSRLAEQGNPKAFALPRPLLNSGNLDFSFAGLKTAVLTQVQRLGTDLPARVADVAASTQAAIVEVLVKKSMRALALTGLKRLVVAGGVGANSALRSQLNAQCLALGVQVHYPELHLCTDNGAMIAMAAAMRIQAVPGLRMDRDGAFDVRPRWPLQELSNHH